MKFKIMEQGKYFSLNDRRDKLIEELAELIRAIIRNDKDNIIEEIADVNILLIQYMNKWGISYNDVLKLTEYKLKRTEERIKDGEI